MKILIRLPNWLGDMVMALGFLQQLRYMFPDAEISYIAKKGIDALLPFFPDSKHHFVFSKEKYKGIKGVWKFGREIKAVEQFDLFFSLPDSFSSALMGFAAGAKKRVGYKKEGRDVLLTNAFSKPKAIHRVEEYVSLLEMFTGQGGAKVSVRLAHSFAKSSHLVININSEASSRRLSVTKAVEIIRKVRTEFSNKIYLIGGAKEAPFVEEVLGLLPEGKNIESVAGKTTLPQLVEVLASAQLMLTTDSGPAHLANALGTRTIVLFGAGNENNTAPYNREAVKTVRLGKLSCEPCTNNICVQFGTPQCLELLDVGIIITTIKEMITAWT